MTCAGTWSAAVQAAPHELAESFSPLSAVMSTDGRHVAWADATSIAVADRQQGGQPTAYPLASLIPPAVVASRVAQLYGISDDGRYLTYATAYAGTYGEAFAAVRFDRTTQSHLVLFVRRGSAAPPHAYPAGAAVGNAVAVSGDGQLFVWADPEAGAPARARVMLRRAADADAIAIGTTCATTIAFDPCRTVPSVSADGSTVVYVAGDVAPGGLVFYDVQAGTKTYAPEVPGASAQSASSALRLSTTGALVVAPGTDGGTVVLERGTPSLTALPGVSAGVVPVGVSDEGTLVAFASPEGAVGGALVHRPSGLTAPLTGDVTPLALSADGTFVLVQRHRAAHALPYVLEVRQTDDDGDGMLDVWETTFGLDPTSAADAHVDANGDGLTNLEAFASQRHPGGVTAHGRYFAEGAAGHFFDTVVSLFNPGPATATVVTRLQGPSADARASSITVLAAGERADIASCCLPTPAPAEFAVAVESDAPVVVERRMTWDRVTGYGSHASTAAEAPSTVSYFAEGATIAGFQTFLLLQNPGDTSATADVDFLMTAGGAVRRTYTLPPASRVTVWVNQEGAPLTQAEFATRVTASAPIVAERAMYRDVAGQLFGAGSNAMGTTAPATTWSFAEGATGPFFDTFLLVANTSPTAGTVTATYTAETPGGPLAITRTYALPPESRLTILLDQEDAALADAAVSSVLTSDVPIVAERAMWWPGSPDTWAESHAEFGATMRGTVWAIADAELNAATGTDTFVLVDADTGGTAAAVAVTARPTSGAAITRQVPLTHGRNTLWLAQLFPELDGQRFSLVLESESRPGGPATLTVEKAVYSQGYAAGAAAHATRLQ